MQLVIKCLLPCMYVLFDCKDCNAPNPNLLFSENKLGNLSLIIEREFTYYTCRSIICILTKQK